MSGLHKTCLSLGSQCFNKPSEGTKVHLMHCALKGLNVHGVLCI